MRPMSLVILIIIKKLEKKIAIINGEEKKSFQNKNFLIILMNEQLNKKLVRVNFAFKRLRINLYYFFRMLYISNEKI